MLRCPHCGKDFTRKEARTPGQTRPSCPWCGRSFPLPADARPLVSEKGGFDVLTVASAALVAFGSYAFFASSLKGPQFLGYYLVLLIVLGLLRGALEDDLARFAPLLLFEGVGVWRIVEGMANGMHRFTYLQILMLFGGFLLVVNATSFPSAYRANRGRYSGSSRSSCSSGSSCSSSSGSGGGGCGGGGGGCGGCGGS